MADEIPSGAANAPKPELRGVVTRADLHAVDFEAPIRNLEFADAHQFYHVYEQAYVAAREAKDDASQIVYRLFAQLCSMVLHPSDPGNIWCPLYTMTGGTRAPIAEDFRGEQTATLSAIVDQIVNPALRARVADIAWSNEAPPVGSGSTRYCVGPSQRNPGYGSDNVA
jgi:hypothetical protein